MPLTGAMQLAVAVPVAERERPVQARSGGCHTSPRTNPARSH